MLKETEVIIMGNCFDLDLRKLIFEIRDLLRDIDQKISHLIEQNRTERLMFFRGQKEKDFGTDEDD